MVWMASLGLLALLLASGVLIRVDSTLYDINQKFWHYAPGDDTVIVAIDPKTLAQLGQWPFPRSLHARLLDRLASYGVRGVALDVSLSTADSARPGNDRLLANALASNGKVVLPMFPEAPDLGSPLEESLPLPAFAGSAAGIGHVDVARDGDGMVRGAYLTAGLGQPYWPILALTLYQLGHPSAPAPLPGLRDPSSGEASPYLWVRDHYVLLRYADPITGFGRVSYADVLDGRVPTELLKDRWVLIGATAEGMGDIIQTPGARIPGVEYQANLFESLRRGWLVTPLAFAAQLAIGAGTLLLPLLLYGLPGFRRAWRAGIAAAALTMGTSLCLLRLGYLWWPPTASLLLLAVGLAGWQIFTWRQNSPTPH